MNGVYVALCLPWSSRAATVATRPSTRPSASMTCQLVFPAACSAVAMNVDIPQTPLRVRNLWVTRRWGPDVDPDLVDLPGPAGSDNGKPKSYEPFWALSRVRADVPIRDSEVVALPELRFRHRLTKLSDGSLGLGRRRSQ